MPPFLLGLLLDWRVWVGVGLVAGALWLRHDGVMSERHKWEAKVAQMTEAARKQEAAANEVTTQLRESLRDQQLIVRTETKTLTEKVPIYVTSNADRACVVPAGFVLHHDSAASLSRLPIAAVGLVDAPSGIPLSAVESVVTENYGAAHELAAEVRAWREWYTKQRAIATRKTP